MSEGKTGKGHALVIGASSGVGLAIAQRMLATHHVTAFARRVDRLSTLCAQGATAVACDVTDLASIAPKVESAVADHGKLDAMIYCAGLQSIKPMRALKVDDIQDVITVNLTAAIVFGRLFASPKITNSDAVFCAISSIAGQRPEPGIVPYSAAKAGVDALVKGLARECGPRRSFGIAPGWLDTEMTQSFPQIYTDAFREELARKAPRGIATVEAVADMVIFLLSSAAAHFTGQIITLDGGAAL